MAAMTILFVPGYWEGPKPFEKVSSILRADGYETVTANLLSTGTTSPGNPNMHDDINAIRKVTQKLVEDENKDVIMVLHSAGGFLGANATEGLDAPARKAKGLPGGVSKMIFLAGAVFPVGFKHQSLPFFKIEGGASTCIEPEKLLFHDLPDADKQVWLDTLSPQPAHDWDGTITYAGWKDVPTVYLVCENDQVIPPPMQVQIAESAGSKVEKCNAGHMSMLSMPERVVEVIKGATA